MTQVMQRINLAKNSYPSLEPNLIEAQLNSFELLVQDGFGELFDEINPISDYTGEAWELRFEDIEWGTPNSSFKQAMKLGLSFDRPLYVNASLTNKKTGEIKKQRLFVLDMP